ncbi:MAG: hypothetical protein ACRD9W_12115, partial [Terriglobia bacterium]
MNSIAESSCRALKSRGSRISRKIVSKDSIERLRKPETFLRIHYQPENNSFLLICDSPGGKPGWHSGQRLADALRDPAMRLALDQ